MTPRRETSLHLGTPRRTASRPQTPSQRHRGRRGRGDGGSPYLGSVDRARSPAARGDRTARRVRRRARHVARAVGIAADRAEHRLDEQPGQPAEPAPHRPDPRHLAGRELQARPRRRRSHDLLRAVARRARGRRARRRVCRPPARVRAGRLDRADARGLARADRLRDDLGRRQGADADLAGRRAARMGRRGGAARLGPRAPGIVAAGSGSVPGRAARLPGRAARSPHRPAFRWAAALLLALALAGGVAASDALQYHGSNLAPTARYEELASIDSRFAGRGPALFTDYDEYALYVLRDLDVGGPGFMYPPPAVTQTEGQPANLDLVPPAALRSYPLIVTRRNPSASRPPAAYRLLYQGAYYEVWGRAPRRAGGARARRAGEQQRRRQRRAAATGDGNRRVSDPMLDRRRLGAAGQSTRRAALQREPSRDRRDRRRACLTSELGGVSLRAADDTARPSRCHVHRPPHRHMGPVAARRVHARGRGERRRPSPQLRSAASSTASPATPTRQRLCACASPPVFIA